MKRKIQDTDLYRIKVVSDPQISPDGSEVAFYVKRVDDDKYFNDLYIVNVSNGKCVKSISNNKSHRFPKWAPDGKKLAYVSDESGTDQIWIINKKTDEAVQLTTMKNGADNPSWSSNSKKILFISNTGLTDNHESLIEEKSLEEQKKDREERLNRVKVINKIYYKLDGVGFFDERSPQIWIMDIENNEYVQITKDECFHNSPAWSPVEEKVVYVKTINQESLDYHPQKSELWIYDVERKESKCLVKGTISISSPSFSPDGKK